MFFKDSDGMLRIHFIFLKKDIDLFSQEVIRGTGRVRKSFYKLPVTKCCLFKKKLHEN